MRTALIGLLLSMVCFVGCGRPVAYETTASHDADLRVPVDATGDKLAIADTMPPTNAKEDGDNHDVDNLANEDSSKSSAATRSRKIIYQAEIELVVNDLSVAGTAIRKMADDYDGYVSNYSEDRTYGDQRTGHWVLRIPTAAFDAVMDKVGDLGVPESRKVDSEDVTSQFVDAEARLTTQRRLEQEMLAWLEKHDGDLKDVIELERELARVRGDIERIEGHLRRLKDQVALTTITIHAREEVDYQPPQAPTFATRISDRWNRSISGLLLFGQDLVVVAVGLAPGLMVPVVLFAPLVIWWRVRRRRTAST